MMAHLRADLVDTRRWLSPSDFTDGMALCQVIPGATMVQMCAYTGYRLLGLRGALAAAVGFVLPACLAMTGLTALYVHRGALPVVRALFRGLGAVVVAIILNACLRLGRTTLRGWQDLLLAVLGLAALVFGVHVLVVLAGAAVLGLPLHRLTQPAETAPAPDAP